MKDAVSPFDFKRVLTIKNLFLYILCMISSLIIISVLFIDLDHKILIGFAIIILSSINSIFFIYLMVVKPFKTEFVNENFSKKLNREDTHISIKRVTVPFVFNFQLFEIFLDDRFITYIRSGEEISVNVPAGEHDISIEFRSPYRMRFISKAFHFRIGPKEKINFECGSSIRGVKIWIPLYNTYTIIKHILDRDYGLYIRMIGDSN